LRTLFTRVGSQVQSLSRGWVPIAIAPNIPPMGKPEKGVL
jgi:hypothetical protein